MIITETEIILPRVVADGPLAPAIESLLAGQVEVLSWEVALSGNSDPVDAVYTFGCESFPWDAR